MSVNDDQMLKPKYGLWNEASHTIFVTRYHKVWGYIYGGGSRELDHGHMLMWLYQMVYVEVVLGVQIDWSTIPCTIANLKATLRSMVILSFVLG